MATPRRSSFFIFALAALLGLASCGSDAEVTTAASEAVDDAAEAAEEASQEGEDHDDDEDHDDEDHDKDHDDEDHDDEDHDDEDHDDDHDDEDHDDEDHDDDHDDEDHGDEDHDDEDDHDHDDSSAGLGAHEHGSAELFVAWSGGDMVIDLISPAFNIVGFENEPTTDEELAVVADRTEALTAPGIVAINESASCALVGDVIAETEFEGSHAEIAVSWSFLCENPEDIEQLETSALFAEFPNLEDVDAQWASDTGQSSAELTPSATTLIFES